MTRFLLLIVFTIQASNSQSNVGFKFYDTCKDSIVSLEYSLQSFESIDDNILVRKDSIVTVNPGVYFIEVSMKRNDFDYQKFSFTKEILDKKEYNDTIEIPQVLERIRYTGQYASLFLGYYKCDLVCDGYIKDFYNNGRIRFEGDFKNGIPINELKKYNIDGELIEIEIYDKDGTWKETKYPNQKN